MNTLTIDPASIAARTKVVVLNCSAWRATYQDRTETAHLLNRCGATDSDAAAVVVRMARGGTLDAITKNQANAYAAHKRLTMPTVMEGMRLLPAGREFQHAGEMREFADRHHSLVAQFLTDYDSLRASAPARLGRLYDPERWPDESTVARKFDFSTRYLSTPHDGAWSDWLRETASAAVTDVREQLRGAIQRVADRCGSDGRLFDTVFSNLRELVELSADLNITGDPLIAKVAALAAPIAENNAETLRDDTATRATVAAAASSLLSYFGK